MHIVICSQVAGHRVLLNSLGSSLNYDFGGLAKSRTYMYGLSPYKPAPPLSPIKGSSLIVKAAMMLPVTSHG
jgi:hypothetical protein